MAKKKPHGASKAPIVVSSHGRHRFMRGMITATLLQRGLSMDDAIDASYELRDSVSGRKKITTKELEAVLESLLESKYGIAPAAPPSADIDPNAPPLVVGDEGAVPYALELLIRPLLATGLSVEDSLNLARAVSDRLVALDIRAVPRRRLEDEAAALLEAHHGSGHARRYRLTCWVPRARNPILIMVGGAAGTGKSTLATEVAYRLGIRKVTSTDMIRETLRTVLPSDVVPGLHDHSFRGIFQGSDLLSDPRERVLAGFHQQAAQVAVGIRAVVRRAVRERAHMVIEGTHVIPPFGRLVPHDATLHLAGVVAAISGHRRHRQRVMRRALRQPDRAPSTYLDAFQSVRWIHDDVVHLADERDVFVLDNSESLQRTATTLIEYLAHALPVDAGPATRRIEIARPADIDPGGLKTLLLVLDGLGDEPCPELGGLTPLGAAEAPTLHMLAGAGGQGLIDTRRSDGRAASTATAFMALLAGVSSEAGIGRGVVEALGCGISPRPDAIYLRGNFATVSEDGAILDRRAGRIREGTAELLRELHTVHLPGDVVGSIVAGHEHRVVVTLQGRGLSAAISKTDPGGTASEQRVEVSHAVDGSAGAMRTAEALNALLRIAGDELAKHPLTAEREAAGLPAANAIITRGAGAFQSLSGVRRMPRRAAIISACPTALGAGRAVGMEALTTAAMTGNLDTDLDEKLSTVASQALNDYDFVCVHIKGTDIAAHDKKPKVKRDFIEKIDQALERLLERDDVPEDLRVVVTADHGTSSVTGAHIGDPVPLLLARWDPDAEPTDFDEVSARHGALGQMRGHELVELLWSSLGPLDLAAS